MSSIYTYDQVKEEFESRELELVSTEYSSAMQKLNFICPKHRDRGMQEIDFKHLHYRHQGCKYCGREKTIAGRTIPEDIVKEKAESLGWEYIGRKTGGSSKIKTIVQVICPNHREKGVQNIFWDSINAGRYCKYCAKNVNLTTEEYKQRVKDNLPHIDILSEYVSQKVKITAYCEIHKIRWDVLPYDLLRETACGCSECARASMRNLHLISREDRIKELERNNPTLKLLSHNVEIGTVVTFECNECGNMWDSTSAEIYFSGRSICPKCANQNRAMLNTKTDSEFRAELRLHLPHIIPTSEYVNSDTRMSFYCSKHHYSYTSMPQSVLTNKNGCPKCAKKYCENLVAKYLDNKEIQYVREYRFNDCVDKRTLPFDYFIPNYNIIIEYDGEDHYIVVNRNKRGIETSVDKLKYVQRHDSIKTNYCLEHNISLIRIPYWEKDNIDSYLDDKLIKLLDAKSA